MYCQFKRLNESPAEKSLRESMEFAQRQSQEFNMRKQVPVTLIEHIADPRAAQLQMLFASMDERGKKTLLAMAGVMVKLQKGEGQ